MSRTSSASPAAPTCRPTTRWSTPASATSRSATSRGAATPPRATPRPRAKSGSPSPPPGPGATNLITAIADAMMDSVPTVFVTGQVRTDLIGTDGFQEADILGATLPFVKHSFQVTDPRQIPEYVHEAFHVASTGRPGPGPARHPAGPLAGRDRLRAAHRAGRAGRLQALDRRQHQTDPDRRESDRQREAAGPLHRRRRDQRQRLRGAARAGRRRPLPGHLDPDGPRRLPRLRRALARDARHARHRDRQPGRWTTPT